MRNDPQTSAVLALVKRFADFEQSRRAVDSVWLFGSWAYGEPNQDSDIDVAIVVDEPVDSQLENQIWADARTVDYRIEPHVFALEDYRTARRALVYDIKEKGIRI